MPFKRPTLPYDNVSLPNSNRYRDLSSSGTPRPPTAEMLDADCDYLIDTANVLEAQIADVEAGILVGSDVPANANLLPTTDGAGNISWIKVGQQQYLDGSITSVALAANSVLTGNIGAGAVTGDKIPPLAITGAKIAVNTIEGNRLLNNTITAAQIANQTITNTQIAPTTITAANIANNTITGVKIAGTTIGGDRLQNQTISRTQMANETITNGQIAGAFYRAIVAEGIITQSFNQNVASCIRTGVGVFQFLLNGTGPYNDTILLGVNTFNNYNITQYLNKATYSVRVYNNNGDPVDPSQLIFSALYVI